ncbi:hypothetical protein VOLCADRAFT_101237, partial [Volvox carteri f. nagariensis]
MSALNNEQVQQRQGTAAQDGANLVINATTGFAGPPTSEAGGITFPPLPNRTSPPAGSPATGAAVVTTAIQQNITPLQQQMAEQSQLLASMAKVITAGQNPAATVLSPAQAAAASVAPDKAKRSKEKRKKKEESSSSSSSSSSDDEAPERLRRLVDRIEAQQPTDPSGFRKQIFHGFATQGKLALALLAEDPPNVKGATKVLKPLIRRAEVGMAVTNTLAAEPRIGLAAADICFSILCNEDKFRDKTKPRKLVDGVEDQALKRAASRSVGLTERLLELGGYRRQPVSVDEDVGPLLRPVQWTQRGGYLSGPLTGTREAPVHSLSYAAFRTRLLKMVPLAGIKRNITAHSMRIGGNSTAADRGVPAELRKAHGRWRTDAMVQHYTRRDTAAKLEVSRRLGLAVSGTSAPGSASGGQ